MIYGESLSIVNNGCLVAKPRNRKVKRLSRKGVKPQAIGGRNELPLTCNDEGEEIVYSRSERKWRKHLYVANTNKYNGEIMKPADSNVMIQMIKY